MLEDLLFRGIRAREYKHAKSWIHRDLSYYLGREHELDAVTALDVTTSFLERLLAPSRPQSYSVLQFPPEPTFMRGGHSVVF